MNLVEHVANAISDANASKSNLIASAFNISGMSSNKVRHLLNNICRAPFLKNYLEIGVHQGSTFIAACYGNKNLELAVAIDNWGEFVGYGPGVHFKSKSEIQEVFLSHIKNYEDEMPATRFINSSAWDVDITTLPLIDVYFYDGAHDVNSQEKALTHYWPILNNQCVVIVDDWNLNQARDGMNAALAKLNHTILAKYDLLANGNADEENYWNGIGIFILEK